MSSTQRYRPLSVNSTLGEDVLLLREMTAAERLSVPFEYALTLLSERLEIDPDDLLGTPMTVALLLPDGKRRFYNGYVSRFSQTGFQGRHALYRAILVPWLWFLSRTADCRIFQDKTVPDIVKQVFRDHGFTDFEERLSGTYRQWVYCVQYRETDLNFVSRLLEHEGIYYFFEHQDGKHTLVLADSVSAHAPVAGYAQVPFRHHEASVLREIEHLDDWILDKEVRSGAFSHNAFDFTAPKKNLLASRSSPGDHAMATLEVFDFQGDYTESADGATYARIRLEEAQAAHEVAHATGNARGLTCGALFTLTEYPRTDQNREYLIVAANDLLQSDEFETSASLGEDEVFRCTLSAIDSKVPYRPPRLTRKPVVQGSQTAIVVGKAGEEIWTDEYGRIKVLFHWDRYGRADEASSCWIRVAQIWAGKGWGGIMTPRIGQEVIVDFLEGDPDQPIVTGRVYNKDCMPPYALPGEATKTSLKSSSSKGGGGFNEIRLEDKKGSEQVFIHAEKNQDVRVKKDAFEWIGNERHLIVKSDQIEQVDGDKHLTLKGDQNEKVDGSVSLKVGMDLQQKVGTKVGMDAGQEIHLKAGMNVVIEAGMSITLKAGGGFVVVGPAGVTISGTPVLINSGGSAGSGSGCSPDAPKAAKEADKADPGKVSSAQAGTPPPASTLATTQVKAIAKASSSTGAGANPQAQALNAAAQSGTPFCEKCEEARRAQAAQV
ncbi:type VI secretion system Vgr family protein [Thiocystis violascens]|uniref:Rhs element Vgr protein n=1 Tax=Thiocystis violascens (strain ATCC 17096 / DSM 198 / 6111) TaxID=765911 RepID=I3YB76_THIV6|nr:type VI secretion system tip protein VgrG [Thiocystis violascens]AFL74244.1 Rhs element Vgr protein [Thiocystis violascens DSM 198]